MKLTKLLISGALLLCSMAASAEDFYLHVQTADGNWQIINIEKIDRLTFTDGKMSAIAPGGDVLLSVPRSELKTINADETQSGIDEVAVTAKGAFTFTDGCMIRVSEGPAAVEVTDLQGRTLVAIPAVQAGQSVDLSPLPEGVYVVKVGKESSKIAVK